MISRDAYQALLKIIPNGNNGTGATTICAPLKQTNYPKVKFLFKQDRSAYEKDHPREFDENGQRGKVQASKSINVSMLYVELVNGEIISGDRASEMRRFSQSIWVLLVRNLKETPPPMWGAADVESSTQENSIINANITTVSDMMIEIFGSILWTLCSFHHDLRSKIHWQHQQ